MSQTMDNVRDLGRKAASLYDQQMYSYATDLFYDRPVGAEPKKPVCPFGPGTLRSLWIEGFESNGTSYLGRPGH